MSERSIIYLCSKCEKRFDVYQHCVEHICGDNIAVQFPSVETFSKNNFSVVNEAYRNYRYLKFIRGKILSLFPEADIKHSSNKEEKTLLKILKSAETLYLKGSRQTINFCEFPDLGPLTFKNVSAMLRRKNFSASHLNILYNIPPTYPQHFTMLRAKGDIHFWPFFFSKENIISEIFSNKIVKFQGEKCYVFISKLTWENIEIEDFMKCVCEKIFIPLLECLCAFVCDCVKSKKLTLDMNWVDIKQEARSIKLQLLDICGGEWFKFFEEIPNVSFGIERVNNFIIFDTVLKKEIESFSRAWIPFLTFFCDETTLFEKYGQHFQPRL